MNAEQQFAQRPVRTNPSSDHDASGFGGPSAALRDAQAVRDRARAMREQSQQVKGTVDIKDAMNGGGQ